MKIRISTKVSIAAVLTILFFGTLATGAVYYVVQKTVIDLEKEGLSILVHDSTMEISRAFLDSEMLTATIAKQVEIVNYFESPVEQDEEILKILNRYNIEDRYSAIYLLSRTGKTLASTDPSFVGKDYSFRTYFEKATKGEVAIEFALGDTSKKFGYYTSSPVRNENKEIIGVAVTKLKPESIHQLVHQSELTGYGHVMFSDTYGVIVYSDKADRIYKSLGSLNQFERNRIAKTKKYEGINISALDYGSVQELIKENKKTGMVEIYDKEDKTNEILAFSRVGNLPFYLVFEEETKHFSSSAINVSLILSLFVLMAAVMATFVIVILTRRFLSPLSIISKTLKDISQGKMDKKIQVVSNDELGEVVNVFNDMIDRVKNVREEVEKKIIARTSELEKFNNLMVGREMKMIELKKEVEDLKKGIKKIKIKNWSEKFREANNYEERIVKELESVLVYKIKMSNLSKEKKEKINKLLKILAKDTLRHEKAFDKLAKKYEGK